MNAGEREIEMAQRQPEKTADKTKGQQKGAKKAPRNTTSAGSAESVTTNDHDEIRKWVEARGGRPASVKGTGSEGEPGILRIEFGDEAKLDEISWEEFFEKFEESNLSFLYQEQLKGGEESRFFKFVRRSSDR